MGVPRYSSQQGKLPSREWHGSVASFIWHKTRCITPPRSTCGPKSPTTSAPSSLQAMPKPQRISSIVSSKLTRNPRQSSLPGPRATSLRASRFTSFPQSIESECERQTCSKDKTKKSSDAHASQPCSQTKHHCFDLSPRFSSN